MPQMLREITRAIGRKQGRGLSPGESFTALRFLCAVAAAEALSFKGQPYSRNKVEEIGSHLIDEAIRLASGGTN